MSDTNELLLSYYGDDFTGSTDAMESLARAGLRTMLFLDPPEREVLARFAGIDAVGVAGMSRSMSPAAMDQALPPIFSRLKALGAPIVHYKTCSTFDSSPRIGSIGHAIDLAQEMFHSPVVPLVVGAPALGRYCVFGNLFARSGVESEPYRLDRHPSMRHHPITPMDESDLRVHLARQTKQRIELLHVLHLADGASAEDHYARLRASGAEIILVDVLSQEHLLTIGGLLWTEAARSAPLFVAGSSGVGSALTAYWQEAGLLPAPVLMPAPGATDRVIVVSGSCSPVTDGQIAWALDHGFDEIPLDVTQLLDPEREPGAIRAAIDEAQVVLGRGRSVIAHTCRGPGDPRLVSTVSAGAQAALPVTTHRIGLALGQILRALVDRTQVRRIGVAGGDTAGVAARTLQIGAVEMIATVAPGAPLCRVHASSPPAAGLEIAFKGGQMGAADFFGRLRGNVR
jgi:uncharacterized protein YgbK (DUF1537 family)